MFNSYVSLPEGTSYICDNPTDYARPKELPIVVQVDGMLEFIFWIGEMPKNA